MAEPYKFDDFPEAFAACRERGRPIIAVVRGETWKLFPSGRAEQKTGYFKTESGGCKLVRVDGNRLFEFPARVHLAVKCDLAGEHPHEGAGVSQSLFVRPDMSDPSELAGTGAE